MCFINHVLKYLIKTKTTPWAEANYWWASIKYITKHWFCKISSDLYCSTLSKDCYHGFYPNFALYGINKTILGSDKITNIYMELLKIDLRGMTNTLALGFLWTVLMGITNTLALFFYGQSHEIIWDSIIIIWQQAYVPTFVHLAPAMLLSM